jgi:3-dehydroquinate dehydratase-2
VINPAGFTYNAVPVLDALKMCECPVVEVHISNIHKRAETEAAWRADSIMSPAATGVIAGLGVTGYLLALEFIAATLTPSK